MMTSRFATLFKHCFISERRELKICLKRAFPLCLRTLCVEVQQLMHCSPFCQMLIAVSVDRARTEELASGNSKATLVRATRDGLGPTVKPVKSCYGDAKSQTHGIASISLILRLRVIEVNLVPIQISTTVPRPHA